MTTDISHHEEAEKLAEEAIQQADAQFDYAAEEADLSDDALMDEPQSTEDMMELFDAAPAQDTQPLAEDEKLDALADAVVAHHQETPAHTDVLANNESTVYAVPYYTTPEGKVRVCFNRTGGMIGFPELSSLIMEDSMLLQPLTNDTNTALSVNLGTHTNAPPLQAAGEQTEDRIWLDADAISHVAGSLPSLDAEKPTPGYTALKEGESYILSPDQNAVMDAAITRLDAAQSQGTQKVNVHVKIASREEEPTPVAQALHSEHHARVAANATDLTAQIA